MTAVLLKVCWLILQAVVVLVVPGGVIIIGLCHYRRVRLGRLLPARTAAADDVLSETRDP